MKTRAEKFFSITGTVQGVGFRPAVYRLAARLSLGGFIQNKSGDVLLKLSGPEDEIEAFLRELTSNPPPNSRIEKITEVSPEAFDKTETTADSGPFQIIQSVTDERLTLSIPPDLGLCPDCHSEINSPGNRRFGYPFTTCTSCGPRYTTVDSMPYSRDNTAFRSFPLCAECSREYNDPDDRRFHAESIACPKCGPSLIFTDRDGISVSAKQLEAARKALDSGAIVAVKGVGGFQLAVHPAHHASVARLRELKARKHRPFALMASDLDAISPVALISQEARAALLSAAAPICVLSLKQEAFRTLPVELLNPDSQTLGFMLPTSALHWLLFNPPGGDSTPPFHFLVMTSGNKRSEPICTSNAEALERLSGISDYFLMHDRDINLRADDSVVSGTAHHRQTWRRGRGYAPEALMLGRISGKNVLATGAELKNTIALGYENKIVMSPHIGDLETPEAIDDLEKLCESFPGFLYRKPDIIASDLHPDMHSSRLGEKIAAQGRLPHLRWQHHHAHAASLMAEHDITELLCLCFDGHGLGTDGHIWGAELLYCRDNTCRRLGTFSAAPLPGGDVSSRHPGRQFLSRLIASGIAPSEKHRKAFDISEEELEILKLQVNRELNTPATHACGRLFDSVSAALGFQTTETTYEGQAAIRLESFAKSTSAAAKCKLPFRFNMQDDIIFIDWSPTIELLSRSENFMTQSATLARDFHQAVSDAAFMMVKHGMSMTGCSRVGASGGVFMNGLLTDLLSAQLSDSGVTLLTHSLIPPNDGGISAGQAYLAGFFC